MMYIETDFIPTRQSNQAKVQWGKETDKEYMELLTHIEQEAIGVITGIIGHNRLEGLSTNITSPLVGSYVGYTLFNGTEYQDWADAFRDKFELFLSTFKENRSGSRLLSVKMGCYK